MMSYYPSILCKKNFGYLIFSICLLFLINRTTGANDSLRFINSLHLGAGLQYGSILPHTESIEYSVESNIRGFEATLSTETYGRSAWDELFRYPRMGVGYLITSLGNQDVFGTANAVFIFMDIPFNAGQHKLKAAYQIDLGMAYINRVYDVNDNPLNLAISTRLNVYGCFRLNLRYFINQKNALTAGFGFSHFSNGKVASPNLGINTGNFSLSYNYRITKARYTLIEGETAGSLPKNNYELILSTGAKTDDQVTGKTYLIATLVNDYYYRFNPKYAAGAGTDLFYDQTLGPNRVARDGGTYSKNELFQFGIHGLLSARYGRLNIVGNLGIYLYANYYKYSRIYTRIGLRYAVAPHIILNLSLKAHYAIADYVEWGIGYRF